MKVTDLMIGDWVLINNIPHKIQVIYSIDAEIQADDDLNIRGQIRYVHELQHALRLCKLDELADNFII